MKKHHAPRSKSSGSEVKAQTTPHTPPPGNYKKGQKIRGGGQFGLSPIKQAHH